jgi:hypothetical protein
MIFAQLQACRAAARQLSVLLVLGAAAMTTISLAACSGFSSAPGSRLTGSGLAGGSPQSILNVRFPNAESPAASSAYVLFCSYPGNDCGVISSSGSQVSTLTSGISGPDGIAVGASSGDWYIANVNDSNVLVYTLSAKGQPTLIKTIDDAGQQPIDVAVSERGTKTIKATVAISNLDTTGGTDPSVAVVEASGKTKTLRDKAAANGAGIGIAFDSQGDCFWSLDETHSANAGRIDEFKKCSGKPTPVVEGIDYPGGVAFDGGDNLWYVQQANPGVYKCSGTSNCALAFSGFAAPFYLSFDKTFANLYVSDVSNLTIDKCAVSGTTCTTFFTTGSGDPPYGVAVLPQGKS